MASHDKSGTEEDSHKKRRHGGGHQGGHPHVEKDESEVRWLISYSDFMMQLVCLFILLYSVANLDKDKAAVIAQSWREEMGLEAKVPAPLKARQAPITMADIPNLLRDMQVVMSRYPEGGQIRVTPTADGFKVQLLYEMFDEGSSKLTQQGERMIDVVSVILRPYQHRIKSYEIVGHTSAGEGDVEEGSALKLSLSRAREAMRWVTRADFVTRLDPATMTASGRGVHEPVTDNADPRTRPLNRRVDFAAHVELRPKP